MAGIPWKAITSGTATGTATLTLAQVVAATNVRARVKGIRVTLKGATTNPTLVEVLRQSSAGSGSSSLTLNKLNAGDDETLQTTAIQNTAGGEPTAGAILFNMLCSGNSSVTFPIMGEGVLVAGGTRLGVRCTTDTNITAYAEITGEE